MSWGGVGRYRAVSPAQEDGALEGATCIMNEGCGSGVKREKPEQTLGSWKVEVEC